MSKVFAINIDDMLIMIKEYLMKSCALWNKIYASNSISECCFQYIIPKHNSF